MFPFFNKKEIKIEDKKSGNNIYIRQETFKTENNDYRIEGVSTSVFLNFNNNFDFFNKLINPFNFMMPFTNSLPEKKNMLEDKNK